MDQDLTREQNMRKKYIELFVDKLYTRFSYLFTDKIEVVKQKALDKYLNSNMTIPEITEDMVKIIEKMKEEFEKAQKEKAEKKLDAIPDVKPTVTTTEPTTNYDVQVDENIQQGIDSITGEKTSEALGSPLTTMNKQAPNGTAANELNAMLDDKPKENKIESMSNSLEKPKQFVKTNNSNNNSNNSGGNSGNKGFVSLFSIGISILAVTAVVLIAMILNLLLK